MKRKFGTLIDPSAVGNPIARTTVRAIRVLVRAQARWRGYISRLQMSIEGNAIYRTGWSELRSVPRWFATPPGYEIVW